MVSSMNSRAPVSANLSFGFWLAVIVAAALVSAGVTIAVLLVAMRDSLIEPPAPAPFAHSEPRSQPMPEPFTNGPSAATNEPPTAERPHMELAPPPVLREDFAIDRIEASWLAGYTDFAAAATAQHGEYAPLIAALNAYAADLRAVTSAADGELLKQLPAMWRTRLAVETEGRGQLERYQARLEAAIAQPALVPLAIPETPGDWAARLGDYVTARRAFVRNEAARVRGQLETVDAIIAALADEKFTGATVDAVDAASALDLVTRLVALESRRLGETADSSTAQMADLKATQNALADFLATLETTATAEPDTARRLKGLAAHDERMLAAIARQYSSSALLMPFVRGTHSAALNAVKSEMMPVLTRIRTGLKSDADIARAYITGLSQQAMAVANLATIARQAAAATADRAPDDGR